MDTPPINSMCRIFRQVTSLSRPFVQSEPLWIETRKIFAQRLFLHGNVSRALESSRDKLPNVIFTGRKDAGKTTVVENLLARNIRYPVLNVANKLVIEERGLSRVLSGKFVERRTDTFVHVIDVCQGLKAEDESFWESLLSACKNSTRIIVVLSKVDLIAPEKVDSKLAVALTKLSFWKDRGVPFEEMMHNVGSNSGHEALRAALSACVEPLEEAQES